MKFKILFIISLGWPITIINHWKLTGLQALTLPNSKVNRFLDPVWAQPAH